jgi:hypothetical protein
VPVEAASDARPVTTRTSSSALYLGTVTSAETDRLGAENAELRRRVVAAEQQIDALRVEALERRAEIRAMAEALPSALSRHALVTGMLRDVRRHPDKAGVVGRAIRKLGRAPRKAVRVALRRR